VDSLSARPYLDYRTFLQQRYGQVLHRVPIDLGLGCPNRDPETLRGGCLFCGDNGARAGHLQARMPLLEQVRCGVRRGRERYGAREFMAYFQAYTSTNAPVAVLRRLFDEVLQAHPFRSVVISTRPDCLPTEVLDYLAELAAEVDLWVELGVQTANDHILRMVNRGHDFACSQRAIRDLNARGIQVAAHVILGLPGETSDSFQRTASELAKLPLSALKIHNLHVVKGTALAALWRQGRCPVWDEHEYAEVLMDFLRRVPADWPIMRMVSDTHRSELLAPIWWLTKTQFAEYVTRQMRERGWHQGDLCGEPIPQIISTASPTNLPPTTFAVTPALPAYSELARQAQAMAQAGQRLLSSPSQTVRVLDVGLGHGFGGLALLTSWSDSPGLDLTALAADPRQLAFSDELPATWNSLLQKLVDQRSWQTPGRAANLLWGDPRRNLEMSMGPFDLILLEVSDAEQTPQLASVDFFRCLSRLLTHQGALVCSCTDRVLRASLLRAGFILGEMETSSKLGTGNQDMTPPTEMGTGNLKLQESTLGTGNSERVTVASKIRLSVQPFLPKEFRILRETLAAVPFRDPAQQATRQQILDHRLHVISRLKMRGWRKRL
jgi:radical SAM protein (TIGR01212 family)